MSLSARLKAWLNGEDAAVGHPITDDAYRTELQLGDLLDITATLSGTATGEGTDLIGVPDGSGYFTGTNLSDVLDELYIAATTGGSDSFTDTNSYYPTDTVGAALVALGVAIGGSTTIARNYTSNKFLTDDATILAALSALDAGAAAAYYAYGNGLAAAKVETRLVADLTDLRTQLTALRVDVAEVRQKLIGTLGKLDLDAGVTDVDYAATQSPAALTAVAPAALTTTVLGATVLSQGGTAGRIKLNADIEFNIGGARYRKAPTDDLWNLSALGVTGGAEYKAVRLYLSTAGAGSVDAGTAAASAAAAKAALPALDPTRAHVGTYVMNPSGNFANALDAQGTYQDGWPVAVAS